MIQVQIEVQNEAECSQHVKIVYVIIQLGCAVKSV